MNKLQNNYIPFSDIDNVQFSILGNENNEIESSVEVKNKELFRNNKPHSQGIYDIKMGTTNNEYKCGTCFNQKDYCDGHNGIIRLPYPVVNPLFKKELLKWLKIICFKCGKPIIELNNLNNIKKVHILNEYIRYTRNTANKNINCVHCNELHPYVYKDTKDQLRILIRVDDNEQRLYNNEIEDILSRITDETVTKLGKSLFSHPKNLTLRTIIVPPVTIRPDIKKIKGGRSNNNDLTTIVKIIINLVDKIPKIIDINNFTQYITHLDTIEMNYINLIKDTPASNVNKLQTNTGMSLMSISSRFPKKTGRIRKNLMGKRTTYMGRSVITGDNSIKINEVGVPLSIAKNIQIPETVRHYNKDRLMIYFLNKDKIYPGCSKIIKYNTGVEYYIGAITNDLLLEDGDIIYRDVIDGDFVAMNRAPSLLYSSISGHIAKIINSGDTLRLSVNVVDTLYGGDFDGDAMMIIFPHSLIARNECSYLCNLERWFISYKNSSPSIGVYHDGLIGISEFTSDTTIVNRYNTMKLLSQIKNYDILNKINKINNTNDGRSIVSYLLPEINYKRKSGHYNPDQADFINYKPNEKMVIINRGKLISGKLDQKTVGQGIDGSIFHIIHNELGSTTTLNIIYNLQQVTTLFQMHNGFTISFDDISICKSALEIINEKTSVILKEADDITKQLQNGTMVPPIGMTINEYYEQQQLSVLKLGDDFLKPVLSNIDTETNNLYNIISSGSKGKFTNLLQISSAIGQTSIGGERMVRNFSYGRTLPYYERFSTEPQSRGFVPSSYAFGVKMTEFLFQAMEARYGIINKALSTSITGHQNRKSIKNLESLKIDNLRKSTKNYNIVQFLYGEDGIDNRFTEIVKFNTIMISNSDFEKLYKSNINKFSKLFQNKQVQKLIDDEFMQLSDDRQIYRLLYLKIEQQNNKHKLISDTQNLPINIYRIIEDVVYNFQDYINDTKILINPITTLKKINDLCNDLLYSHYNQIQQYNNKKIPNFIKQSFTLIQIAIRSNLYLNNIVKKNIDDKILDIIILRIKNTFNNALIEAGTPIGIISAQCISEPMTQYVLDSLHRSGSTGTKTDFLVRTKEILGAKETSKMKYPLMNIFIDDKYIHDKFKIQEIANHIEMMPLMNFINSYQIFFEDYKKIVHPEYKDEIKLINLFEKHNPNLQIPNNLIKWCIRLDFNKEMLIEKNMKFETVCMKLKEIYPLLFIVNTAENTDNIIMRIYIQNNMFKRTDIINLKLINKFINNNLLKTIIRGVDNILSTHVHDNIARSFIEDDGSIIKKNIYSISTNGTNLEDLFDNEYINPYLTQSDSIIEIQELLGIEAARQKLIMELRNIMPGVDDKHYMIFADEMAFTGEITSIEKSGLEVREKTNVLLHLSNSHPIQFLENAAINNITASTNHSLSSALMVGKTPDLCANFNDIVINENFIQNN